MWIIIQIRKKRKFNLPNNDGKRNNTDKWRFKIHDSRKQNVLEDVILEEDEEHNDISTTIKSKGDYGATATSSV